MMSTDLEVDGARLLLDAALPVQRVEVALGVCDGQGLRAMEVGKQPLLPVAGAEHRLAGVGLEADHIGRPVVPVAVLQAGCVRVELDGVGVALGAQRVDALGDGRDHARVVHVDVTRVREVDDAVRRVDLVHTVLAKQHADIFVVGRGLPVVIKVEVLEEVARFLGR